MSLRDRKAFERTYPSIMEATQALKRFAKNEVLSPEGKQALEIFELIGLTVVTTVSCAKAGAAIGAFFGPEGIPIGAGVGALVGLGASALVIDWYVRTIQHKDGSVTLAYSPN